MLANRFWTFGRKYSKHVKSIDSVNSHSKTKEYIEKKMLTHIYRWENWVMKKVYVSCSRSNIYQAAEGLYKLPKGNCHRLEKSKMKSGLLNSQTKCSTCRQMPRSISYWLLNTYNVPDVMTSLSHFLNIFSCSLQENSFYRWGQPALERMCSLVSDTWPLSAKA